ncbi:LIM/homeobox protein Lhx9-like [Arapaima gigas]
MSGDSGFEELLIGSLHGDDVQGVESDEGRNPGEGGENTVAPSPDLHLWASFSMQATAGPAQGPMLCGGCGRHVWDRFVLFAAGHVWHEACLCCSVCQCELQAHPSLYCRDGRIYCQQDYCRLFSVGRCARCSQPIPSSALVMRSGALTFHPHCFTCQECNVTLLPGNLYCMQGTSLFCQFHYRANSGTHPSPPQHLRHTKRDGQGEEPASSPEPRLEEGAGGSATRPRAKRIRTCFRTEQLRAMESYFALKHNPDGKDWSCLSHRTGLPKRVLQVWFQNARAKLRRSLSVDESQSASPVVPPADITATSSASIVTSQAPEMFPTSTINQLELSLITAPLDDTLPSPSQQPQRCKDPFYMDHNTQNSHDPCPPVTFDFGESDINNVGDTNKSLKQYY